MFLNDLFTIRSLNSTSQTIIAEIRLNASHHIFTGHFPGLPVTPGVVQLEIVKEILELHLQKGLLMKTMRTCKFLNIINPLETPLIEIHIKFIHEEFLEVVAYGTHDKNTYFKAQVSYI